MRLRLSLVDVERLSNNQPVSIDIEERNYWIGRAEYSDWCLPDPSQTISRRHCQIRWRDEGFFVVENHSDNGTLLNAEPVGADPVRLHDGDRISLGDYVIAVRASDERPATPAMSPRTPGRGAGIWDDGAPPPPPPRAAKARSGPWREEEPQARPSGYSGSGEGVHDRRRSDRWRTITEDVADLSLLDEPAESRVRDRLGLAAEVPEDHAAKLQPEPRRAVPKVEFPEPEVRAAADAQDSFSRVASTPGRSDPARTEPREALREMLQGAGLTNPDSSLAAPEVLHRAGALLRRMTIGLAALLEARTKQKQRLGIEGTIAGRVFNPLKVYADEPERALAALLGLGGEGPDGPRPMAADRAVSEAFRDLETHQLTTLAAMEGALTATLKRFSPDAIRRRASEAGVLAKVLPRWREAELWRAYEREFDGVVAGSEEAFIDIFAREFRRAYERAADPLKRV